MSSAENPLDIVDFGGRMYIPLDVISEDEVERLRAENLKANTVDSTAEELGEPAPGIKDAQEAMEAENKRAFDSPVSDQPSPADALG